MKKLLIYAACSVMALASCNQNKKPTINPAEIQNDSLRAIIDARDNEVNDMMATLNQIQQGARRNQCSGKPCDIGQGRRGC